MTNRSLVVSLHDVSPHTLPACRTIVFELEALGVTCSSLLVIPNHHQRGHFLEDEDFCDWLTGCAQRGHEAVIHGYFHRRVRRDGESFAAKLTTRVYTADEGEFFDLDRPEATVLVSKARDEFRTLDLAPSGFIAPAWLLSKEAETALRDLGIRYTTRLANVSDLPTGRETRSQSLVWSVRSAWRRVVSLAWNAFLFRRLRGKSLLRISVHPVDLQHTGIWRQIRNLTKTALQDRTPLTYEAWVSHRMLAEESAAV